MVSLSPGYFIGSPSLQDGASWKKLIRDLIKGNRKGTLCCAVCGWITTSQKSRKHIPFSLWEVVSNVSPATRSRGVGHPEIFVLNAHCNTVVRDQWTGTYYQENPKCGWQETDGKQHRQIDARHTMIFYDKSLHLQPTTRQSRKYFFAYSLVQNFYVVAVLTVLFSQSHRTLLIWRIFCRRTGSGRTTRR